MLTSKFEYIKALVTNYYSVVRENGIQYCANNGVNSVMTI